MTWRAVARRSDQPGLTERSPVRSPVGARSSMTPSGVGLERSGCVRSFVIAVVSGVGYGTYRIRSFGASRAKTADSVKRALREVCRTGVHRQEAAPRRGR